MYFGARWDGVEVLDTDGWGVTRPPVEVALLAGTSVDTEGGIGVAPVAAVVGVVSVVWSAWPGVVPPAVVSS